MPSISTLLLLTHLVGLSLAVGAATTKLALLLKSRGDIAFAQAFVRISRTVTRFIIAGIAMLTVSGIGWIVTGYPFTEKLIIKLVLVAAVWMMGPYIDNVIEPQFAKHLADADGSATEGLLRARRRYLVFEMIATGLFYAIVVIWVVF